MGKLFSFERFIHDIPVLLPYLSQNLKVLFFATLYGVVLGIFVSFIRIKKIPVLYQLITLYVSFMRGTPMLVQLMLVYYGLPLIIDPLFGIEIGRVWNLMVFAYITFTLNQGAFLSSIFIAAIESIPRGQCEAAYSVGLSEIQGFYRILMPQAIRIALPPFGTDFIGVLHNASLIYVLGVIDLVGRAKAIGVATGHTLEAYIFVAIVFVLCSLIVRVFFEIINQKLDYQNRGVPS